MKPVTTLVLLAAEKAARFYRHPGIGKGFVDAETVAAADFADSDAAWADRPGRGTGGPGTAPHGFDPHRTERDLERARFAAHVIAALAEKAEGADRIVIAAAPRMLGELRAHMPAALAVRVAAELDKDIVKAEPADLPAHLAGVLAV
jgi:protein required for attachment to host cells